MIGLIGAMAVEVELIKDNMTEKREETISGITFVQGKLESVDCVAAVSGIGKVNAAMCAQTMILRYHPRLIINTGVAGGMGKGIKISDIVVADSVVQHDMDTSDLGDPKGFISGIDRIQIPCDEKLNDKVRVAAEAVEGLACHQGIIATGDQFVGSKDKLNRLMEEFGAVACEMEGGSIGQVCYINKVPFTVVRAISDNANDDAHMDYPKFLKIAVKKSFKLLTELMPLLA